MALEAWVLDGVTLTSGSFLMMSLTADPPKAKPQWIGGVDSEWQSLLSEPLHENREFVMKLRVPATAAANMDAALDLIASIRDKLRKAARQPDGIALVWTPNNSARSRTFDVLHGEITELPIDKEGEGGQWMKGLPIFALTMTAKPYWYDTAETLTSTTSAATPIVTIDVTGVGGDIPALGRLIVTDNATQARRDVEWGLENRSYNAGLSFMIDSDSMTLLTGTQTTRSGAYDPNATGNSIIRAAIVTAAPIGICSTGAQSHIGTFRIWARCYINSITQRVRFSWRVGDERYTSNTWATPPTLGFVEIDLGTITIPTVNSGTQVWDGRVEAFDSSTTPQAMDVDYLRMTPAGEGYGRARTVFSYVPGTVVAYDDFNASLATALNARVAPLGGTWASTGSAPDFTVTNPGPGTNLTMTRTGTSQPIRTALLGSTNYTNVEVSFVTSISGFASGGGDFAQQGVLARYVDSSNYLNFRVDHNGPNGVVQLQMFVAAVSTQFQVGAFWAPPTGYIVRLIVLTSGLAIGQVLDITGNVMFEQQGYSAALATGGTLATGKPGFFDYGSTATSTSHYYDTFQVSTPAAEQLVINSGRSIQFRHDDTIRLDSTGAIYGKPTSYRGGRFLVPPGSSRIAVASRRVDLNAGPADNVVDSTTLQVGYRNRGLVVPRA